MGVVVCIWVWWSVCGCVKLYIDTHEGVAICGCCSLEDVVISMWVWYTACDNPVNERILVHRL